MAKAKKTEWLYLVKVNKEQEEIINIEYFFTDEYKQAEKSLESEKRSHRDEEFRLVTEEEYRRLFEEVFDNKTKKMWKIYTEEFDDPYCPPYISDIGIIRATHYEAEMYCYKWNEAIHKSEEYGMRDMAIKCSENIPLKEITLDTPPLEDIKEPEEFHSEEDLF